MINASSFLQLEGIQGESTRHPYAGWMEIHSWGLETAGKHTLKFTAKFDRSATSLYAIFKAGRPIPSSVLVELRNGSPTVKLTIGQSMVSSISMGHSLTAGPREVQVTLSAAKITVEGTSEKLTPRVNTEFPHQKFRP